MEDSGLCGRPLSAKCTTNETSFQGPRNEDGIDIFRGISKVFCSSLGWMIYGSSSMKLDGHQSSFNHGKWEHSFFGIGWSQGFDFSWFGDGSVLHINAPKLKNDYKYFNEVFMFQIAMVSLLKAILEVVLKPFGFTSVLPQILSGQIFGGTGLSQISEFDNIFNPLEVAFRAETLGPFGVMIYLFLIGVKMDLSTMMRSSRKVWVIGISTFIIPFAFTLPTAFYIRGAILHETDVGTTLPLTAVMVSMTSFHTISSFLSELKILNTELGRQATSISTISGTCSWIALMICFAFYQYSTATLKNIIGFILSTFSLVIFITVVLRKVVNWIIKQTPNGEVVKDIHLFIIFLMIPATAYIGEIIGVRFLFGPIILGLIIPDGPPLGSALTDKLECLISGVLMPIYFVVIGNMTSYESVESTHGVLPSTMLLMALGFLGKFIGAIIPCLFHNTPFKDATMLGLVLTTLGLFDVTVFYDALTRKILDLSVFGALIYGSTIVATVTSPLVRWFYKPSTKYFGCKNRTIQNAKQNDEFCMLVCVYNENNVPAIVNLIEASNPTKKSPISVYLLHLIELYGRSTPFFIAHQTRDMISNKSTPSDHIVNCFRIYEKRNHGVVVVHAYTTVTPFVSAHEDICTMALDKKTSLIIIPFHKQWNVEGVADSSKCRNINKKVLSKAPCSVGILIDRGRLNNNKSVVSCWSTYNIGVIYLGGPDDREALFYATRMAEHPNINLTVHHLIPVNLAINNLNDKILDDNFINRYRLEQVVNGSNMYKEEVLENGLEVVRVIRAIENSYDLMLVGRQQNNYSSLLAGLLEWNEYPEVGFFGDMFASSDFKGNIPILVVQQHSYVSRDIIFEDLE